MGETLETMATFSHKSTFPVDQNSLFNWHTRPGAFERLTPPWVKLLSVKGSNSIEEGARVKIRVKEGFITTNWSIRHRLYKKGSLFSDILEKGPFCSWHHEHKFSSKSEDSSSLEDLIEYKPFGGVFAGRALGGLINSKLKSLFRYRHELLALDLERFSDTTPQKILISGGTGLIGRALSILLKTQGHEVVLLSRTPGEGRIVWNPQYQEIDPAQLEGFDVVFHLAGEGIMGRWTEAKKKRIYESRILGTRLLCKTLAGLEKKPKVLVSVSGISASYGKGFLAEVGAAWEAETRPASDAGIRVFIPRVSVVLSPAGGALKSMLPLFKLGLGGRISSGEQHMSWIAMDDLVDILYTAVLNESYVGPVDIVAPEVPTNAAFTIELAQRLHRPAFLPVPGCLLKLFLGEVAQETALADIPATSEGLEALGYRFRYPTLREALSHLLP